ncbi:CZB domain-containing protein [Adhaeribacter sp. BT258]|uniref:CZB domain-containing protein n=1 Tax=Adhaeribacter terrigena TaxID=2793070 RepID=A0ABS1C446_9BACT|nr:CZB domain-containing protein [Adhaeribacter terrigena]MBK0404161.1 CZB domain-containing protein [Adhaeribacter terrigena]
MAASSLSSEDRLKLKHEFESATVKHILFKSKVKSYLYGSSIDLEPIVNFRVCSFGQWIYDRGMPLFGQMPEMRELEKVHKEIHDFASYLVKLKQENQTEEALDQLPKLEMLANGIFELLKKVQEKAGLA